MWEEVFIVCLILGGFIALAMNSTRDKTPRKKPELSRLEWEEMEVHVNRIEEISRKSGIDTSPVSKWLVSHYKEEMYNG